ncbi:MAG TPA: hypothetical protein DE060_17785 [Lentisphaeria bacterium]|nr:hypothetical protein [Lentisphaeria bacterium]HCG51043.1 hypothetical protein [Lentisphaeria bacterium]
MQIFLFRKPLIPALVIITVTIMTQLLTWGKIQNILCFCFIFAIPVLMAFIGFRTEKQKSSKRKFYFSLSGGICIAMLSGVICALFLLDENPPTYTLNLQLIEATASTPISFPFFGGFACFTAFVYLCFFYGRISRKNTGSALLLSFSYLIFIPLCLSFFTVGFLTFFFSGESLYNAVFVPFYQPCWIFIFAFSVILIRIIFADSQAELTWKRNTLELLILAAVSAVLWGTAHIYSVYLKYATLTEVERQGILWNPEEYFAFMKGQKNGAEVIRNLEKQKEKIDGGKTSNLPHESIRNWLAGNNRKPEQLVTEQEKAEEIAKLQTPEYEKFFQTLKSLEQYDNYQFIHSFGWDTELPHLNSIRSFMRRITGRAAVAHYQKQSEKVIPYLKDGLPLEKSLRQEPCLISELVRIGIVSILVNAVVKLGPDSREYLPDYRMFLSWMQSLTFTHLEDSVLMSAYQLSRNISFNDPIGTTDSDTVIRSLPKWIMQPLEIKGMVNHIQASMSLRKECMELIGKPQIPMPRPVAMKHLGLEKSYHDIMLKFRSAKDANETALALKIYRVEHGSYPKTTRELVPEILKNLPLDPLTGQPYVYRRLNHHTFELEYYSRKNSKPVIFSSIPSY